jgi:hypothetical protein
MDEMVIFAEANLAGHDSRVIAPIRDHEGSVRVALVNAAVQLDRATRGARRPASSDD